MWIICPASRPSISVSKFPERIGFAYALISALALDLPSSNVLMDASDITDPSNIPSPHRSDFMRSIEA